MAIAETAELVATLRLDDRQWSQAFGRARRTLGDMRAQFGRTEQALGKLQQNMVRGGVALVGAGTVAFKWAADFEEQLATINTVAGVSQKELAGIGESIKTMAMDSGTSIKDLASAYYDLVSAGVSAADAQKVLAASNKLAIGGLSTTGEAVDLLTTAMNVYGLSAEEAEKATDGFAQAIAAGKVTAAQLAASFAKVAPFAKDLGIEIEELQAGYGLLTAKGIPAAEATTYMRSAIVALMNPTTDLERVQKKLNIDFAELARDRGLVYAYNELRKTAQELGIPLQKLTGRIEGAAFASNTAGKNFRAYNRQLADVRRASDGAGVAQQQMAERQRTVNAQLRRLRETVRTIGIDFGTGLLPGLNKGFQTLGNLIRGRRQQIKALGQDLGGLMDRFFSARFEQGEDQGSVRRVPSQFEQLLKTGADALKAVPWDTIKSALETGAQVAKTAVELFSTMPKEVRDALIVLAAANKVTGGLASGLIRDIGSLFLKSLTTINAAHVTVVGATGPGAPGVPGPTAPGAPRGSIIDQLSALIVRAGTTNAALGTANEIFRSQLSEMEKAKAYLAENTDLTRTQQADIIRLVLSGEKAEAAVNRVRGATQQSGQRIASAVGEDRRSNIDQGQKLRALTAEIHAKNAARLERQQASLARLNAAEALSLTWFGRIRDATGMVAQEVRRKDLNVRVAVSTNVSMREVATGFSRVVHGNRVVID